MKISDYMETTYFDGDGVLLTDGPIGGTKKIKAKSAIADMLYLHSKLNQRLIYRGKFLGNSISEFLTPLAGGFFQNMNGEKLWIGDYWTIGGINWRIADFNYWYGVGDTPCVTPHIVIVPDTNLNTSSLNDSATTAGGYVGTKWRTSVLPLVKDTIINTMGISEDNLLSHREYLVNAVTSGYPSAGAWTDSDVELMNEPMVYGNYVLTPGSTGSTIPKRYTASQKQLALFALAPWHINCVDPSTYFASNRISYWLRDVVSDTRMARVTDYGPVTETAPSLEYGIRPVFAICG